MAEQWDDLSDMELLAPEPEFDASKWDGVTSTVKLLSVNWTRDYKHVVAWESEESRNEWFENADGASSSTEWNYKSLEVFKPGLGKHVGDIRIEVPYEQAINFNYIYVEMGEQPVPGLPDSFPRREHYFYFLTSLNKISPSTTELFLELDTWTTYFNSIEIPGINLIQGHYPLALTSADEFLENPLANSYGLTEPERELPNLQPLVSYEKLVSFQGNEARVCIATTADFSNMAKFWLKTDDINSISVPSAAPTTTDYWTEKPLTDATNSLGVNGNTPVAAVKDQVTSNPLVNVYSMSTVDYASFINKIRKQYPQVLKTIQAIYLLDSVLIDETGSGNILGTAYKTVKPQNSPKLLETLGLSKAQFDYDPKYADIAKLYTGQFAKIEITNLDGAKAEIAVEDVAEDIEIYARAQSAFPFLKLEAFLNGVGGNKEKTYAVKSWNNVNAKLFESSWEDFTFSMDIPTYGVFTESREINGAVQQIERYRALKASNLSKTVGNLNTANTKDNSTLTATNAYENDLEGISLNFTNTRDSLQTKRSVDNSYNFMNRNVNNNSINNDYTVVTKQQAVDKFNVGELITMDNLNTTARVLTDRDNSHRTSDSDWSTVNITSTRTQDVLTVNNTANYQLEVNTAMHEMYAELRAWQGGRKFYQGGNSPNNLNGDPNNEGKWGLEANQFIKRATLSQFASRAEVYHMLRSADIDLAVSGANGVLSAGTNLLQGNIGGVVTSGVSTVISNLQIGAVGEENMNNFTLKHNMTNPFEDQTLTTSATGVETYNYSGPSSAKLDLNYSQLSDKYNLYTVDAIPLGVTLYKTMYNTGYSSYNDFYPWNHIPNYIHYTTTGDVPFPYIFGEPSGTSGPPRFKVLRDIEKKVIDLEYDNARTAGNNTLNSTKTNATNIFTTENVINTRVKQVSEANDSRLRIVQGEVNDLVKKTNTDNQTTIFNTTYDNTTSTWSTDMDNNLRTKTVREEVELNDFNTQKAVIDANNLNDINIINREYDSRIADLTADINKMLFDNPIIIGANSGSAWLDSWGQRGIDIKIKRVSKGAEKIAGDYFLKNGYTMSKQWIENPELNIMTVVSYWLADDVWVSGKLINETNKEIIRGAFLRGVNVWANPEEVQVKSIYENKRREI